MPHSTGNSVRIIHVTEALGGGVLYHLHQLIKAQINAGFEVILIHSNRRDTPASEELDKLFPFPALRVVIPMATNISIKDDLMSFRELVDFMKSQKPDVIHLHSSKAGALGRVAASFVGMKKNVHYSPHGFSFLRRDVSWLKRALFFTFEVIGGMFGGNIIASSASEGLLAAKIVGRSRVSVVENCTDVPEFSRPERDQEAPVRVTSAGRLSYQKAPWRFWKLAKSLSKEKASFTWLGDGELRGKFEECSEDKSVRISGWIERESLWHEMHNADLYVMTSLWEGMPLTLLDAQAIGLPSVVSDVVGCRDVVIDGITGFICKDGEQMIDKVRLLIRDKTLRKKMSREAKLMANARFSLKRMHSETMNAYNLSEGR